MLLQILEPVAKVLAKIPKADRAKIEAQLKRLTMDQAKILQIKTLRKKIKEIIINQYRIIFFTVNDTGYIVDAFQKKTRKTPKRVIEKAEKIYKIVKSQSYD